LATPSALHVAHADAICLEYASRVRQACAFNKAKVGVRRESGDVDELTGSPRAWAVAQRHRVADISHDLGRPGSYDEYAGTQRHNQVVYLVRKPVE
jgi:hypothetical protein